MRVQLFFFSACLVTIHWHSFVRPYMKHASHLRRDTTNTSPEKRRVKRLSCHLFPFITYGHQSATLHRKVVSLSQYNFSWLCSRWLVRICLFMLFLDFLDVFFSLFTGIDWNMLRQYGLPFLLISFKQLVSPETEQNFALFNSLTHS